mmetsp:Transcript_139806/g.447107  ORF Transcript_139806/g.447107 Transcript_139806/m.447107 type:complete len:255 (-) Transcript_139806:181-945(-)
MTRLAAAALVAATFAAAAGSAPAFVASPAPTFGAGIRGSAGIGASLRDPAPAPTNARASAPSFASAVGAAAAAAAAVIICRLERKHPWFDKRWANYDAKRFQPMTELTPKVIQKRVLKVRKMIRSDMMMCNVSLFEDPRSEEWQLPTSVVKGLYETPDFVPVDKQREAAGAPMPPFTMGDKALREMRGEKTAQSRPNDEKLGGGEDAVKSKKKAESTVDLGTIDLDFIEYKGIKMTKKEMARLVNRKSGKGIRL